MVKSIGGALALVASLVTLLAPTAALAHAKWFADYDMVGQPRAIGSLQPAGRPVIANTGTPAAASASSAAAAAGPSAPSGR